MIFRLLNYITQILDVSFSYDDIVILAIFVDMIISIWVQMFYLYELHIFSVMDFINNFDNKLIVYSIFHTFFH